MTTPTRVHRPRTHARALLLGGLAALALPACSAPTPAARAADAPRPRPDPLAVTVAWGAPLRFAPTLVAADDHGAVVVGPLGAAAVAPDGTAAWHRRQANVGLEVPALDGDGVALAERVGDDPHVGAALLLDRASGELRWRRELRATAGPVALTGDLLLVATEGRDAPTSTLHALDRSTGATAWQRTLPGRVPRRSTIALDAATATAAVVLDGGGRWVLALIEAATGADRGGLDLGTRGTPSAPAVPAPGWVAVGNGSTGEVLGVDLVAEVVGWVTPLGIGFDPASPAAVARGLLVVADAGGDLHGLDAATGARRWHAPLGAPLLAARPAIAGGAVAVADFGGTVHTLDAATGAPRPAPAPGGTATGLAASGDSFLVALRMADPDRLEAWHAPAAPTATTAPTAAGSPGGP